MCPLSYCKGKYIILKFAEIEQICPLSICKEKYSLKFAKTEQICILLICREYLRSEQILILFQLKNTLTKFIEYYSIYDEDKLMQEAA